MPGFDGRCDLLHFIFLSVNVNSHAAPALQRLSSTDTLYSLYPHTTMGRESSPSGAEAATLASIQEVRVAEHPPLPNHTRDTTRVDRRPSPSFETTRKSAESRKTDRAPAAPK